MADADADFAFFEGAEDALDGAGEFAEVCEGGAGGPIGGACDGAWAPAFDAEAAEEGAGDGADVELGVEGLGGFFDGDDGFGEEGVVAGEVDAVGAEDKEEVEEDAACGGAFGVEVGVFAQDEGDVFFEFGVVDAGFAEGVGEGDLDDFFGVLAGDGGEEVGEEVAHVARELADESPVDEAEAVVGGDEDVAGMGVCVEEAGDDDLVEDGVAAGEGDGAAFFFGEVDFFGGLAADPLDDEHAAGGVFFDDDGGEDALGVGVDGVEVDGVAGLDGEVELAEHAGAGFFDDGGDVEGAQVGDAVVHLAGEPADDFEVGLDGALDVGALEFYGDFAAVFDEAGAVDLAEGAAGDGGGVEVDEVLRYVTFELVGEDGAHLFPGDGADLGAEFFEFVDEAFGEDVGAGGDDLAEFDEGGAKFLEGDAHALPEGDFLGPEGDDPGHPGVRDADLPQELEEAVSDEDGDDFLGPDGVREQEEGLQEGVLEGPLQGGMGFWAAT